MDNGGHGAHLTLVAPPAEMVEGEGLDPVTIQLHKMAATTVRGAMRIRAIVTWETVLVCMMDMVANPDPVSTTVLTSYAI